MEEQAKHPTLGHMRVRAGFNPSREEPVDRIKADTAVLINEVNTLMEISEDKEVKRLCALAMTAYEEAAMWAVKAATANK